MMIRRWQSLFRINLTRMPAACRAPLLRKIIIMATTTVQTAGAQLLDVQAVAEMLGCSTRHVYRLNDRGEMPANVKLGALVRWSKLAIEEWIAAACPSSRAMRGRVN